MRVLYVEDHEDTAFVIGKLLQAMGHAVKLAASCRAARGILQTSPVDVLISDLNLPDGDGCALMREAAAEFNVPGIAITGHSQQKDIDAATAAGFIEHLAKPLSFPDLQAALTRIANRATSLHSTPPAHPPSAGRFA